MRLITVVIIMVSFSCFSQSPSYWVKFTDKNNSSFSVATPEGFLSQRSINRRTKSGIAVVENDLPVNSLYIDSILNSGSFQLLNSSKWFNAIAVRSTDTVALALIQTYSFVDGVVKVKTLKKDNEFDKFTEVATEKSNINLMVVPHYPFGYTYNQLALHGANKLHDLGLRGQGMHIAIIDAGFFRANELEALSDLFDEGRILSTRDFVSGGESVYEDHTHGTMVLSIIGGSVEGEFKGAAPEASFHLLRSEDSWSETLLEEYNWIAAAEYADSAGVDIINTSLGYTTFDDTLQNHIYSELDGNTTIIAIAADIAASKGMLLCTSAGNSGASPWQYISTPADADSTLTVAAVDSNGTRAFFSSVGPAADNDVKPNVASVGWNTYLISPWSGEVIQGNGTSFSSPMMAGMAACLWQGLPSKSNMEIMKLIEESSSQYAAPDSLLGYGIPDMFGCYSKETGVIYENPSENNIESVFPNPIINEVNAIYISENNQGIIVRLYTNTGSLIQSLSAVVMQGKNLLTLSYLDSLLAGDYIFEIQDNQGNKTTRKIIVI